MIKSLAGFGVYQLQTICNYNGLIIFAGTPPTIVFGGTICNGSPALILSNISLEELFFSIVHMFWTTHAHSY